MAEKWAAEPTNWAAIKKDIIAKGGDVRDIIKYANKHGFGPSSLPQPAPRPPLPGPTPGPRPVKSKAPQYGGNMNVTQQRLKRLPRMAKGGIVRAKAAPKAPVRSKATKRGKKH